jgi:hypothetical protein
MADSFDIVVREFSQDKIVNFQNREKSGHGITSTYHAGCAHIQTMLLIIHFLNRVSKSRTVAVYFYNIKIPLNGRK